jgi:hypothetical protein
MLLVNTEGKRPHGRHWLIWKNNFKLVLQKVVCGGMDWIHLAQDRNKWRTFVNALMNSGSIKSKKYLDQLRISYFLKDSAPWSQ